MNRAYPGSTFSATFTVTTGGTFEAEVSDATGRKINASVSEAGGTATLTVAENAWINNQSGTGRIHITRQDGGTKSVEVSEAFRILAKPDPVYLPAYS